MKKLLILLIIFVPTLLFCGDFAYLAKIKGAINPVSARYIEKVINKAEKDNAELVILTLDTPGGLMNSMSDIVQAFLNSNVPIIVYVSPKGARAASAGAFITMASHIAVMSSGTHIGAAHPVDLGGNQVVKDSIMAKKVLNDAVAQMRSICELRGRNADIGEQMVREAISISSEEAFEYDCIDIISDNLDSLLDEIDGWKVQLPDGAYMLSTSNIKVKEFNMNPAEDILYTILDPNIAYILMLIGVIGIFMELSHPGAILPGVVGGICLLLAFYAFQVLPINYVGVILILFGIILLLLEIKITSYGILAGGGIISMLIGSFLLTSNVSGFMRISWISIIPGILILSLFFLFIVAKGLSSQRKKVKTGEKGMIGQKGIASSDITPTGKVLVHGEYWNARSSQNISKDEKIEVVDIDGMELIVIKKEDNTGGN